MLHWLPRSSTFYTGGSVHYTKFLLYEIRVVSIVCETLQSFSLLELICFPLTRCLEVCFCMRLLRLLGALCVAEGADKNDHLALNSTSSSSESMSSVSSRDVCDQILAMPAKVRGNTQFTQLHLQGSNSDFFVR
jgi:hypothetical protein